MHKTGSTSIQRSLSGHDDGRVRYADFGHPNHSRVIRPLFDAERDRRIQSKYTDPGEAALAARRDRAAALLDRELAHDAETLVLCAECFSVLPKQGLESFKAQADRRVREYLVIGYVREPFGYLSSALQQRIRQGHPEPVRRPDYRAKFEKFIDLFGREACVFREFRTQALVGGSSVADFCHVAGIDPAGIAETRVNRSINLDAVRWLWALRNSRIPSRGPDDRNKARSKFRKLLRDLPSPKFALPRDVALTLLDPADIAWMEAVTGFDLQDPGQGAAPSGHADLDAFLRDIRPDAVQRLKDQAARAGIATRRDDPAGLVVELYRVFLRKARRG